MADFASYEREYRDRSATITCATNELETLLGQARQHKILIIEEELLALGGDVRNMEVALQSAPEGNKQQLKTTIANYRSGLQQLQREFEKAKDLSRKRTDRQELLGSGNGNGNGGDGEELSPAARNGTAALLNTTRKIGQSGETIKNSMRLVEEMSALGDDTMGRLRRDREVIERSIATTRETATSVSRARRMLTMMQRRNVMNKLAMVGIIVLLIIAIVFVIYLKASS
eukprot:TRINITY_DN3652_c0_g1_i1.p2 TRINITY_DN3652_c0_g1~~TRINITY_DN3652_c0_g1_i1.p2  ORF type:complete len:229 (-),score=69.36 TRINITY_DN3652_c0_g1_i1:96-782(-)